MSKVLFDKTMENPLGEQTGWSDHERITVGVHARYTFNSTPIEGLITIIQQEEDDEDTEDFRDMGGSDIMTTAAGARRLAALLIEAAEAAERRPS